jgi:hypothetical protein
VYTFVCPRCAAEVSLPARRLLLRVDGDRATSGEVLFTCLGCHQTVAVGLDGPAVAGLLRGGVTHLTATEPAASHPEGPPAGPPLTHDDLLDLHRALAGDGWFSDLAAREGCE